MIICSNSAHDLGLHARASLIFVLDFLNIVNLGIFDEEAESLFYTQIGLDLFEPI